MHDSTCDLPNSQSRRPADAPPPEASHGRLTFSAELRALKVRLAHQPATLHGIMTATQSRGFDLLLVLICLPFLVPVPLLGLSTPFGLGVFLIGVRVARGGQLWLPQRLLRWELPRGFMTRVLGAATRVVRVLESLLRPRLGFLHERLVFRRLSGVLIMISGLLLLLPVPVPFTNTLPALTVILLAAASMERDGLVFLAGCGVFTLTLAYFSLLGFGGSRLVSGLGQILIGS